MDHSLGISPADLKWEIQEFISKIGDLEEYNPDKPISVEEMTSETQLLMGFFGAPVKEEEPEKSYAEKNAHLFKGLAYKA